MVEEILITLRLSGRLFNSNKGTVLLLIMITNNMINKNKAADNYAKHGKR